MRSTQVMGLPIEAIDFLDKNVQKTGEMCKLCEHSTVIRNMTVYDSATARHKGMFNDGPDLFRYILNDGRAVEEFVQAVPWSSGPCIFLGLREADLKVDQKVLYQWPQKAIDNA